MSPQDKSSAGQHRVPSQAGQRRDHPGNVRMPSPPPYPRPYSPSYRGHKSTTPTGQSPNLSPSTNGPLSPNSSMGQNSYIFPIRSVYQGMNQADSPGEHGTPLSRATSNSYRYGHQSDDNRRQSISGHDPGSSNVVGISTIAQMLEESSMSSMSRDPDPKNNGPGFATFNGKDKDKKDHDKKTKAAHNGFFSVPLQSSSESSESPFFNDARRASDPASSPELVHDNKETDASLDRSSKRPDASRGDSDNTVHGVHNPSAEASGSGLPDKARQPVGQPQRPAQSTNYQDRPGQTTGDQQSYHERTANPPPRQSQPTTQSPELKAPQPRRPANNSTSSASSTQQRSQNTHIETDEEGQQAVVADYSGIVRLDAGSHPSSLGTGDSGTGGSRDRGKGSGTGSIPSGPTNARLAHQQRSSKVNNTRDSVRDFVNSQAQTTNLLDPNAPTPSPTPHDESALDDSESGSNDAAAEPEQEWADSSENSMSVRESSEVATAASRDDKSDSEAEEPIVTFRFEHVATDDGHHVVVGREGMLQRCEDEPITTPGAVQGFGVLLVLEDDYDTGRLSVRQVSENATELLGLSPRYLFRLDCFTRVLTDEQEDILRDNVEYLPDTASGKGSVEEEGPQVFLLSGFGEPGSDDNEEDDDSEATGRRREWTCWVAAHRPKQPAWDKVDENGQPIPPPDLIVLEFELEKDVYNPLMQTFESVPFSSGGDTPESGSQTTTSRGPRSASTGSAEVPGSDGSMTTVGSTPVPPASQRSDSGTIMRPSSARNDSDTTPQGDSLHHSSSRKSSHQPQGLDGIDVELPLERIIESTTNHAKPLRALERMRRTGQHGDSNSGSGTASSSRRSRRPRRPAGSATGTMDVFAVLGQINEQLGAAPDLETFLKITVGVVQDLCRFHRVLIYQFDETFNGQVVAELVEWGKTTDLFKGLMFPAADIPAQARELYKINKVRLLYDRSQTTARMVLRSREDLDNPLDMTHCYLRAMSPIHIKYLANMHVRSSMSVSIMAFGQLWGLIACHSYGHHGMRVSFPVRQMMRILSDSISRNIERLSYAQRLHTRKLISTIPSQHHPTGYIVSNADDLLQIFDADSGLLVIGDGCKLLGNNEQGTAMLAIAEFLRIMRFESIKASNHLARDFPDLILPRAQDTIAGLLYVPLTAKAGQDFIVFLRKGQVREVQWAGKPYKDESADNGASLEPRKSFKTWSETVTGRSRTWTDDQLESAGVLALIYGKFIQVWREKQSAMASNQLTAILLSNTSHAVRTPLSQIINTLELALSGDIDADTRSMLENSHQASRALLFHVHDLLDLTRIETGNETAFNDPFDIRQSIADAIRLYQTEASRRQLEFIVNMADNLPQFVIGDSRKIKTVVSNLVANAIKFTDKGHVEIYCGVQKTEGHELTPAQLGQLVPIEIVISDTGHGIPNDKLEAMFMTLEGAEEIRSQENPGLGLGLAVVARIVEQLSGQLRAESEVGVGTRFFFTLPMRIQQGEHGRRSSKESSSDSVAPPNRQSSGSGSVGSLRSRSASSSQGQSEIDSFVYDFASSHMLAPVNADDKRLRDAEERMNRPGTFPVTDSSFPVRPTRMDDQTETSSPPATSTPQITSPHHPRPSIQYNRGISYQSGHVTGPQNTQGHARRPSQPTIAIKQAEKTKRSDATNLRVLVVEDDPINSQILQKRLKMDKHVAIPVTNGQEAVDFLGNDRDIDVVLMDIQMPIMDGRTAAKEIRKLEKRTPQPQGINPLRIDDRIPIFAVSASLYESDRTNMAEHFDGWILKPLDFNRVRAILTALEDPVKRSKEVYVQGQWEKGGYLQDARNTSPNSVSSGKTTSTRQ